MQTKPFSAHDKIAAKSEFRFSEYRMAGKTEMDPDLIRPAGDRINLNDAITVAFFKQSIARFRRSSFNMLGNNAIGVFHRAADERQVNLFYFALMEYMHHLLLR